MFKNLIGALKGGVLQGKVVHVLSKTFDLEVSHPAQLEMIKENTELSNGYYNEFELAILFLADFFPTILPDHPKALSEVRKCVTRTQELYSRRLAAKRSPALALYRAAFNCFKVEVEIPDSWWLTERETPLGDCPAFIDFAGPAFGDEYRAVFTVRADEIAWWMTETGESGGSSGDDNEAARQGLITWARRGNEENETHIKAPKSVHILLKQSIHAILKYEVGFYQCLECLGYFNSLNIVEHNKRKEGGETRWLEEWRCDNGHTLHMAQNSVRFVRGVE